MIVVLVVVPTTDTEATRYVLVENTVPLMETVLWRMVLILLPFREVPRATPRGEIEQVTEEEV